MRENVCLEFDKKLVTGDSASTDILVQEVVESCEGSAYVMFHSFLAAKSCSNLSFLMTGVSVGN